MSGRATDASIAMSRIAYKTIRGMPVQLGEAVRRGIEALHGRRAEGATISGTNGEIRSLRLGRRVRVVYRRTDRELQIIDVSTLR